eukprot:GILI01041428.1.p1 GENE.GILI01041428.1~~GILI01041428.1.p1  ORF type:complete len:140 (-),score=17.40 GILI01041428.1:122-520(-)
MPPPNIEEQLLAARHALTLAEDELAGVSKEVSEIKTDVSRIYTEIKIAKQQTRKHLQTYDTALMDYEECESVLAENRRRHDDLKARYDEEIPSLTANNTMLKLQKQRFDEAMFDMEKALVEELANKFATRRK